MKNQGQYVGKVLRGSVAWVMLDVPYKIIASHT